jgi:hypothetical protein
MTRRSRILAVLGTVVVLIIALLIVLPIAFAGQISERAKAEVNKTVNARVDWSDAGLSFFRHFPNLTLSLNDLTTVGTGHFVNDTLAAVRHLRVVLDLGSVVGSVMSSKPVLVRAVELDHPRLSLIALEDGTANWDITKRVPEVPPQAQPSRPTAVSLRNLSITDGVIRFDNRQSKMKANLVGYHQTLSGEVSGNRIAVQTKAGIDTATVVFGGIPYLNRVKLGLTADATANTSDSVYTLKDTELRLNDLRLGVSGSARTAGKKTGLDLTFNAPTTSFKSILSLVPAVYAHDFDKVKTSGTFALNGKVKGEYGENAFPSFAIHTKVNDATFQYPDLPLPARSIFVDLSLDNPGGKADATVVKLDRFHVVLGQNPIDAKMLLKTPISDPDVDATVNGKVDLVDVSKTVKLQGIEQLSGTIAANATVRTRMSAVTKQQYDKVAASGSVDVAGLTMKGKTLPHPLTIQQASLTLAPARAQLKSFTGTIGSSDLQASGTLTNLIGYALHDDVLGGTATLTSNHFDLDEWRSNNDSSLQIIPVPKNLDFTVDAAARELLYSKIKMTDARGRLRIRDQRVTLDNFTMNALGGQMGLTGYYDTRDSTKPAFDAGLKMNKVDIPSAFQALTTVQMLAPIAKYASGNVSTDLHVNGALGKNMMPLLAGLTGAGQLQTSILKLNDFPGMQKIADVTGLSALNNPTFEAIKAAFDIQNGRLAVKPFNVKVAGMTMSVAGSNGLDQTIQYTLGLKVPRSLLGTGANQAIAGLASNASKLGIDLNAASEIPLNIQLAGPVTSPTVKLDLGNATTSVAKGAEQAVTQKMSAEALKLVQEAQDQATKIRQEGQALADKVKKTGYDQADSLVAKAGNNMVAQIAAKPAADQIRKQTDNKAAAIVNEAGKRADSVVAAAKLQAEKLGKP